MEDIIKKMIKLFISQNNGGGVFPNDIDIVIIPKTGHSMGGVKPYVEFRNSRNGLYWRGYCQLASNGSVTLQHSSGNPTSTTVFNTLKTKNGDTITLLLYTDSGMSVDVAEAVCNIDIADQSQVFTYTYFAPFYMDCGINNDGTHDVTITDIVSGNSTELVAGDQGYITVLNSEDNMYDFESSTSVTGGSVGFYDVLDNELFQIPLTVVGGGNNYQISGHEIILAGEQHSDWTFYLKDVEIIYPSKTLAISLTVSTASGLNLANIPVQISYKNNRGDIAYLTGFTSNDCKYTNTVTDAIVQKMTVEFTAKASTNYNSASASLEVLAADTTASWVLTVTPKIDPSFGYIDGMLTPSEAKNKFGIVVDSDCMVTPDGTTWARMNGEYVEIGYTASVSWWDTDTYGEVRLNNVVGDNILGEDVIAELQGDRVIIPLVVPVRQGVISRWYLSDGDILQKTNAHTTPLCRINSK